MKVSAVYRDCEWNTVILKRGIPCSSFFLCFSLFAAQSLDCDVSEKVKDYIQLMSRTELLTVAACNSSFSRILEDASHVSDCTATRT